MVPLGAAFLPVGDGQALPEGGGVIEDVEVEVDGF